MVCFFINTTTYLLSFPLYHVTRDYTHTSNCFRKDKKCWNIYKYILTHRYGCWGVCFTNGTWFAVDALVACGRTLQNSPTLQKACQFLLSKQLPDGGWGESYLSSSNKVSKLKLSTHLNWPCLIKTRHLTHMCSHFLKNYPQLPSYWTIVFFV